MAHFHYFTPNCATSQSNKCVLECGHRGTESGPHQGKLMSKTWFITGTSSGFGRQLTEQLLERGDRVFATLRKPTALDDLRPVYGERLRVATLDVTDAALVRTVVDRAFAELGRIDVVVNNAA